MSVKTYYHINITSDGYQLFTSLDKIHNQGALVTLKKIEIVVFNHLPYISSKSDPFGKLNEQEKELSLKNIAIEIKDHFLKKKSDSNETSIIKTKCLAIENRVCPSTAVSVGVFENTHEAINLDSIVLNIFKYLTRNELMVCGLVSKKWNDFSKNNFLWLKFYNKYFRPLPKDHIANFYYKTTNCLFNNLNRGRYVETTILSTEKPDFYNPLINENVILFPCPNSLEVWIKNEEGKFNFLKLISKPRNSFQVLFNDYLVMSCQNQVFIQRLILKEDVKILSFPFNINWLKHEKDHIFIKIDDGTLYNITYEETEEEPFKSTKVGLLQPDSLFLANSKDWLIILHPRIKIEFYKKIENGEYVSRQFLDNALPKRSKFYFHHFQNETNFLFQEAVYQGNFITFVWKYDLESQHWVEINCLAETVYLAGHENYIFTGKYSQNLEDSVENKHTLTIEIWEVTKTNLVNKGNFKKQFSFTEKKLSNRNAMQNLDSWSQLLSFTSFKNYLHVLTHFGDLHVLNAKRPALTGPCVSNGSGYARQTKMIDQQHISMHEGKVIIRQFNANENEIIDNLILKFLICPPVRKFNNERQYLLHRFKCLNKLSKRKIYHVLSKIISSFNSLASLRLSFYSQPKERYAYTKKEFYGDSYDPSEIADAISIFSRQREFGMEALGEHLNPSEWNLIEPFLENFETSDEVLKSKLKEIELSNPANLSICKVIRFNLQLGEIQIAREWIKLLSPELIQQYLSCCRKEIQDLKNIYLHLIEKTESQLETITHRIYICFSKATSLVEQMESLFNAV